MKTISLKKVAVVAVASLGFGLLSVVPVQAAVATTAVVELDASDASTATLYTTAGTEVTLPIYLQAATAADAAQTITLTPTISSQPAGDTLSVGTAASGKVGMTTAGTLGAGIALTATANKWTAAVSSGVQTLTFSSGLTTAMPDNSEQVVGTFSITPTTAGRYVVVLTPTGTASNTAATITVYAAGASGTVGTSGVGTAAITAQVGGQAAFTYTFPDATPTGTIYQVQKTLLIRFIKARTNEYSYFDLAFICKHHGGIKALKNILHNI